MRMRPHKSMAAKLSELRNQLVHNVTNADFDFTKWVESLKPNQLEQFCAAFGPGGDTITLADKEIPSATFFRENVRVNIWLSCLLILSLIYQRKSLATLEREVQEDFLEFGRSVLGIPVRPPRTADT